MKIIPINIPEGIRYLGMFKEIEDMFPSTGSFILDKTVCGCGATTLFLQDPIPTILCSPRNELMRCKAESPAFKGKIHLFRDPQNSSQRIVDLENAVMEYIGRCGGNPFSPDYLVPKILVSYDSLKYVVEVLKQRGILGQFRVIVDEAQTIFTDAAFRGEVVYEFLSNVRNLNRVIFVSAKPYIEDYLDQIDYFKDLPYIKLQWPESAIKRTCIQKKLYNVSLANTVKEIIADYRKNGFFAQKLVNGQIVQSNEAVFFLNNLKYIIQIIKSNGLSPADTNVICARDADNEKRLQSVGFHIGHAPGYGEPHKTFTFVTKAAFEGVDFYSPCAYTYVMSDITMRTLGVDISLDLLQIMGRQRLEGKNLFLNEATVYYKTLPHFNKAEDVQFRERIENKLQKTQEWLDAYSSAQPSVQATMFRQARNDQQKMMYQEDYISTYDDRVHNQPGVGTNELVMYNEIRAWEIQKNQYYSGTEVIRAIDDATFSIAQYPDIAPFLENFTGSFANKMKLYCDLLSHHPDYRPMLEWMSQIPLEMKEYYNALGPERIRALCYNETNILKELKVISSGQEIKKSVRQKFFPGAFYDNATVKSTMQYIYDMLGLRKIAKANDIEQYYPGLLPSRGKDCFGQWKHGYLIPRP